MAKYKSFRFFCQKVLPLVYDESLSYYETICKLVEYVNGLVSDVQKFSDKIDGYDLTVDDIKKDIAALQAEIEKIKNGGYSDIYVSLLEEWMDNNAPAIIKRIVKYIFFGLTNDGYFCAMIPESWEFISFDTIMTSDDPLYGHLLLKW